MLKRRFSQRNKEGLLYNVPLRQPLGEFTVLSFLTVGLRARVASDVSPPASGCWSAPTLRHWAVPGPDGSNIPLMMG